MTRIKSSLVAANRTANLLRISVTKTTNIIIKLSNVVKNVTEQLNRTVSNTLSNLTKYNQMFIKSSIICLFISVLGTTNLFSQPTEIYDQTTWDAFVVDVEYHQSANETYILMVDVGTPGSPIAAPTSPIGGRFEGTFDGGGHTVYVNISSDSMHVGLFSYVGGSNPNDTCTIKNLTVAGSITATGSPVRRGIGGIAGRSAYRYGTIIYTNCSNKAVITSTGSVPYAVGGISGLTDNATVKNFYFYNCTNYVDLPTGEEVGGIAATVMTSDSTHFINCTNYGNLNGIEHVGGIASCIYTFLESTNFLVINCNNYGNVTGSSYAGGIVGYLSLASERILFDSCSNYGDVTGNNSGGIIGRFKNYGVDTGRVKNCINNGTISGGDSAWIGGIVGCLEGESWKYLLEECKNAGTLKELDHTTPKYMGGIVGGMTDVTITIIKSCINIGKILRNSTSSVGGILGYTPSGPGASIKYCANAGLITKGIGAVGGIVGHVEDSYNKVFSVIECINTNWIGIDHSAANSTSGSIVGVYTPYTAIQNCYYDNQMSIIGGLSGQDRSGQAEGRSTMDMVRGSVMQLGADWYFEPGPPVFARLYPRPLADKDHIISKLSAAPIYLKNNEKVNRVDSSFVFSNGVYSGNYIYPYKWGSWKPTPIIFQEESINGHISLPLHIDTATITWSAPDSLIVRLDTNTTFPIFEKWVPINGDVPGVTFEIFLDCGSIELADTTNVLNYYTDGYSYYKIKALQNEIVSFNISYYDPCCATNGVMFEPSIYFPHTLGYNSFSITADANIKTVRITATYIPLLPSIEVLRHNPLNEKTNEDIVTFRVEIRTPSFILPPDACYNDPQRQHLEPEDFIIYADIDNSVQVDFADITVIPDINDSNVYYVKVNTKGNTTNNLGFPLGCGKNDTLKIYAVISCNIDTHYVYNSCSMDERYILIKVPIEVPIEVMRSDFISYPGPNPPVSTSLFPNADPAKTNKSILAFTVNIKDPSFVHPQNCIIVTKLFLEPEDFIIYADNLKVPDSAITVNYYSNNIYYVSINTNGLYNHLGNPLGHNKIADIVKIDAVISCGIDTHYVSYPCSIDERYDVRKVFWAEGNVIFPDYNPTIKVDYDDEFILKFDEPVIKANNIFIQPIGYLTLEGIPSIPNNIDIFYNNSPTPGTYQINELTQTIHFRNYINTPFEYNTTYNINLVGDILMDEWGNLNSSNPYPTHFTGAFHTSWYKIAMQDDALIGASNGAFTVSNVTPNPAIDKTEFTISTFVEGKLNVAIYDLAGGYVMDVISNKFIDANTELKVPMHFGLIPNGTYTIIVSLDNSSIIKQVVIVK